MLDIWICRIQAKVITKQLEWVCIWVANYKKMTFVQNRWVLQSLLLVKNVAICAFSPLSNRETWKKCSKPFWQNLTPPNKGGEKSAPNTFQKGASLKHLTNLSLPEVTWAGAWAVENQPDWDLCKPSVDRQEVLRSQEKEPPLVETAERRPSHFRFDSISHGT